jgi:hypothetical protein
MRSLSCLLLVLLLACGAEKSDQHNISEDSVDVQSENTIEPPTNPSLSSSSDSSVYIGPVYAFMPTQEYYTPVFFINDSSRIDGDDLRQSLDSIISEEEEEKRSRVRREIAQKSFHLTGLDTISIFDNQGVKLYRARLERVEYFDTFIDGEFIAVYKPIGKIHFRDDVSYCVSKGQHPLNTFHYNLEEKDDDELSEKLIETFDIKTGQLESIKHFALSTEPTIYSIITTRHGSTMVETTAERSREVIKRTDNIVMLNLYPVHFKINDHPVLLVEMGVAESDGIWISLFTYSDGVYKANARNRIYF